MNATTDIICALPPPPGVVANFVDPAYNGTQIIIAAIVVPIITIPFLVARLYVKSSLIKQFHCDDYLIIVAMLFSLAYAFVQIYQTKNGSGYHMWDIPLYKFEKYEFVGGIFTSFTYQIGTLFIKSSILLFFLRLPSEHSFKICTYIVLAVTCGNSLFGGLGFLFMCRPMEKYWNPTISGNCLNFKNAFFIGSWMNVVVDVVMLLLPIWLLRPLRLPLKQKIGLLLILMTGSFVCIVSIIRLSNIPTALVNPDFTWVASEGYVLSIIEMHFGVICACLPSLKTIFKHHYPRAFEFRHFTTPYLDIPTQPLTNVVNHFKPNREQMSAGSSVRLHTFFNDTLTSTDSQGQDGSSSNSLTIRSIQPPDKVMVNSQNWGHDVL